MQLTPFEWSMLDEVAGCEMVFFVKLHLRGRIERPIFEQATQDAISTQPLLQANLDFGDGFRNCHWVQSKNPQIQMEWSCNEPSASKSFDLACETGLKIRARVQSEKIQLYFLFHHSCCDGIGGIRFIEQVLCNYHRNLNPKEDVRNWSPDASLLAIRDPSPPRTDKSTWFRWRRSTWILPYRIFRILFRQPVQIYESKLKQAEAESLDLPTLVLTEEQTKRITQKASELGVGRNELLLRDMLLAIHAFTNRDSAQRVQLQKHKPLRIMLPISTRSRQHKNMPAANCVSMVAVEVDQRQLEQPNELVAQLKKQIEFISHWQVEFSWSQSIAFLTSLPLLKRFMNQRSSPIRATGVFSNAGRVFKNNNLPRTDGKLRTGEMVLDSFHASPPGNENVPVTFSCNYYANRLTLTSNFNHQVLSRADAEQLFKLWVECIEKTIEGDFV